MSTPEQMSKADKAAEKARKKALRPWYAKKRFILPIAFIVIAAISANSGSGDPQPISNVNQESDQGAQVEETTPQNQVTESEASEDLYANESVGETNARESAESYLNYSAFSKLGLVDQLLYEDFSQAEAEYAVGAIEVDWSEQAVKSAESYLQYSAFSQSGLRDQLLFEKFTEEEANFGVANVEADWMEQAAKSAKNYLDYSSFSRQGLIDQLIFEGFTKEQAEYGVSQNGY